MLAELMAQMPTRIPGQLLEQRAADPVERVAAARNEDLVGTDDRAEVVALVVDREGEEGR